MVIKMFFSFFNQQPLLNCILYSCIMPIKDYHRKYHGTQLHFPETLSHEWVKELLLTCVSPRYLAVFSDMYIMSPSLAMIMRKPSRARRYCWSIFLSSAFVGASCTSPETQSTGVPLTENTVAIYIHTS